MSERQISLIQRAAARLKQTETPGVVATAQVNFSSIPHIKRDGPTPVPRPSIEANIGALGLAIDRGKLAQAGISFSADERSRLTEEFRVIKRQVLSMAQRQDATDVAGKSKRLILVTSARPLEGKTFVAANLALAIAS